MESKIQNLRKKLLEEEKNNFAKKILAPEEYKKKFLIAIKIQNYNKIEIL